MGAFEYNMLTNKVATLILVLCMLAFLAEAGNRGRGGRGRRFKNRHRNGKIPKFIKNKLFPDWDGSDKHISPVPNDGGPTKVTVNMYVRELGPVNLQVTLRQEYHDSRLNFDDEDVEFISLLGDEVNESQWNYLVHISMNPTNYMQFMQKLHAASIWLVMGSMTSILFTIGNLIIPFKSETMPTVF